MRAEYVGALEAAFVVGCLASGGGALAGVRWLALAGVALVILTGAACAVIVDRCERSMRVPTLDRAGIGHRGARHTVGAQVTAREAGTP